MTNEEAITNLKIALNEVVECIDSADVARVPNEAYVMKPALEMAIEALEKQIPKKLVNHDNCGNEGLYYERCPICFEIINDDNYCHNCGQKLD